MDAAHAGCRWTGRAFSERVTVGARFLEHGEAGLDLRAIDVARAGLRVEHLDDVRERGLVELDRRHREVLRLEQERVERGAERRLLLDLGGELRVRDEIGAAPELVAARVLQERLEPLAIAEARPDERTD